MGYSVYEDRQARDHGVDRWAGYGVPATCDKAACSTQISRGLDYKCEHFVTYEIDEISQEEREVESEGCGLFFCGEHQEHGSHVGSVPKPDSAEWNAHLLSDESWQEWRDRNPERVALLRA